MSRPRRILFYRHKLPVRLMHWINAFCLAIMLMSGLSIFNAHPILYCGKASDFSHPILSLDAMQTSDGVLHGSTLVGGHAFNTTGHHDLSFAARDGARGDGHRVEARTTETVDGRGGDGHRKAGEQRGHAGDVAIILAGLIGAADEHVIHRGGVEGGVADQIEHVSPSG